MNVREYGVFYMLWTGWQWKAPPRDLPPKNPVHDYLELWNWDGTLERIHHALYLAVRAQEGREASIVVDTLGFPLSVIVHTADIQDRDGAFQLPRQARQPFPFIGCIFPGGACRGGGGVKIAHFCAEAFVLKLAPTIALSRRPPVRSRSGKVGSTLCNPSTPRKRFR